MDTLRSKQEIQSFLGRINFLIRFIPNLAEISRKIIDILKWDIEVKWNEDSKKSFSEVKATLSRAPTLANPNYTKEFIVFSFTSKHNIAMVILQKQKQGVEQFIAFFCRVLRDVALNYDIMEKQAFVFVKALKDFQVFMLHSHVVAYVPSVVVKNILT